jgi:hypothetical protein
VADAQQSKIQTVAMTPAPPAPGLQRAPLDVYKKITVIRRPEDTVVYEDSHGRLQRITDLGDSALTAVSLEVAVHFLVDDVIDIPSHQEKIIDSFPSTESEVGHSSSNNYPCGIILPRYSR